MALTALAGGALAVPEAPTVAPAPRPAKPKFTAPKFNDTYEVLIFTNLRPLRVQVTVLQDGKSLGESWRSRLRTAFDYFDRDGDGTLNAKETTYAFSDRGLVQLLQNGLYQPTAGNAPTLAQLDLDSDGKVSFEEFVTAYPLSTAQLVRAMPVQPNNYQNVTVTESLFALMDANSDGSLTRDEVKAVEKLLASRDEDEDECLSIQELAPQLFGRNPNARRPALAIQPNGRYPVPAAAQTVVIFDTGRVPGTITQQVIKKYDKDGDFELTKSESGFDDLTFAALDTDKNGNLDGEELDVWRTGAPDLELTLSLATKPGDCVAKLGDEKSATARGFKIKHGEDGRLTLRVGRQPIDLWAFSPGARLAQAALKQQYSYLFTQAAGDKKHIEEKDLNGPNAVQFQFVRVILDAADRNTDGKLTKDEFDAYFDLQDGFRNLSLSLVPTVQTPTLFQLLDESRDGRLSVRELRTAWDRLIALEEPGATVITKNVIQPAISLRLSRSYDRYNVGTQAVMYYGGQNQVAVPTKGPLWFRKMDRNGDGDVSRGEFVGSRAEFDTLDSDHDDLISLEEAEAYDKKMREKPADKK